jgi:hypothetical protein
MKRQLAFLGIMMIMGVLAMASAPVLAADTVMYETKFDPYFIGRQQRDNLIVVNHFGSDNRYSLRVEATAYDPFTGELLDTQSAAVPQGQGVRMPLTLTYPNPHASRLVVTVEVDLNGGAFDVDTPPFTITRILTTGRDATVLQTKGDPTLQIAD